MAIVYSQLLKQTPQTEKIPFSNQVPNAGGGFSWKIDKWELLNRFLILGSEKGTYYIKERALTVANAENVIECIKEDGMRVLKTCVEISHEGRAPKNDPAIFVLALICTFGDQTAKQAAYRSISLVCRIGTHLFTFMQNIKDLRKWSRGLRNGVASWYLEKTPAALEYQLLKYKQRNGWSHRDVLRLCHAKNSDIFKKGLLTYAVTGDFESIDVSQRMGHLKRIREGQTLLPADIIAYGLSREMLPTESLNDIMVWKELLKDMPMHAMLRNLAKMTAVGLLKNNLDDSVDFICTKLRNELLIQRSRLHPIAILNAMKIYASGRGDKGKLTWSPVGAIVNALDDAFRLAFKNVEPTNKRIVIGLDVSGSMHGNHIAGTGLDAATAAFALSLITAQTEPRHEVVLFSTNLIKMEIKPDASLSQMMEALRNIPFGGTDCSLPILHAMQNKLEVDAFIIYTDNETNSNSMHPSMALELYRKQSGIDAKLIVVGMCANDVSIANPLDKGMLDIVGFSTDVPAVIREFIK